MNGKPDYTLYRAYVVKSLICFFFKTPYCCSPQQSGKKYSRISSAHNEGGIWVNLMVKEDGEYEYRFGKKR
jgi:hypothetical protein